MELKVIEVVIYKLIECLYRVNENIYIYRQIESIDDLSLDTHLYEYKTRVFILNSARDNIVLNLAYLFDRKSSKYETYSLDWLFQELSSCNVNTINSDRLNFIRSKLIFNEFSERLMTLLVEDFKEFINCFKCEAIEKCENGVFSNVYNDIKISRDKFVSHIEKYSDLHFFDLNEVSKLTDYISDVLLIIMQILDFGRFDVKSTTDKLAIAIKYTLINSINLKLNKLI